MGGSLGLKRLDVARRSSPEPGCVLPSRLGDVGRYPGGMRRDARRMPYVSAQLQAWRLEGARWLTKGPTACG
jgi:hypothetical protein